MTDAAETAQCVAQNIPDSPIDHPLQYLIIDSWSTSSPADLRATAQ